MTSLGPGFRGAAAALRHLEEAAKTAAVCAQAALSDDHRAGAIRHFLQLHELLVPALDGFVVEQLRQRQPDAEPLSTASGLLALWQELPDLDIERESLTERLAFHTAQAEESTDEEVDAPQSAAELQPALKPEVIAAQQGWLQDLLSHGPLPRSHYYRRLIHRAHRPLGDLARIQVQRGALTLFERLPTPPDLLGSSTASLQQSPNREYSTWLAQFQPGDRLTLQWQLPLPGQVAVLHAASDEPDAELSILLPQSEAEAVARRQGELIEVTGELSFEPSPALLSSPVAAAQGPSHWPQQPAVQHSLLLLWVPELVPPRWVHDVLARRTLPPEARLWRYCYSVLQQQ